MGGAMAIMAVGVIFGNRCLRGSCAVDRMCWVRTANPSPAPPAPSAKIRLEALIERVSCRPSWDQRQLTVAS